jgi:hypothetical protein
MSDNVYKIDASEDTPLFLFDKDLCCIHIKGVSMPENAFEFYDPLEKMILENISGSPVLEIELSYMNSMSNKQLLKLIKQLASKSSSLKVIWKYAKGDSLIKNKGEEICTICAPAQVIVEESV